MGCSGPTPAMPTRTLLIALVIAMYAVIPAHAARQALVIGNDNYTSVRVVQVAEDREPRALIALWIQKQRAAMRCVHPVGPRLVVPDRAKAVLLGNVVGSAYDIAWLDIDKGFRSIG